MNYEDEDDELKDSVLGDLSEEVDDHVASGLTIHINLQGADAHPVAQPDKENPREKERDEYEKLLDKMSGK